MKPGGDEPESVAPQGEAVPDLDAIRHQWPLGEAAGNILTQAEAFARELGGMPRITTTVLLFAIARTGIEERSVGMPDSAASRLLDLLGEEGETRLSAAMIRYRDANLRPAIKHAGIIALTPGVGALFNRARALAQGHAASAERAVGARHLVGALLERLPGALREPGSHHNLRGLGHEPAELLDRFLGSLHTSPHLEIGEQSFWFEQRQVLHRGRLALATYDSDHIPGADRIEDALGLQADVDAIANLIASSKLQPPLSLAVFGDWGSGKSHFMGLLRQRVAAFAEAATASESTATEVHHWHDIVQIEFNAWHYIDANLWASLVAHLFNGLARRESAEIRVEREAREYREAILRKLRVADEAQAQARRELAQASEILRRASTETAAAAEAVDHSQSELAARLGRSIYAELAGRPLPPAFAAAREALGTVVELADDIRGNAERIHRLLVSYDSPTGRVGLIAHGAFRWWHLAGPAVIALVGLVAANRWWPHTSWPQLAALATAGAVWITQAARSAAAVLTQVRSAQARVEEWLEAKRAAREAELSALRTRLETALQRHAAAATALATAQRTHSEALAQLQQPGIATLIADFVSARAESDDCRRNLGLVSTIREDFERLSALIEKHNALLAAGQAPRAALGLNRIILYIDDLDRCPPERVLEVLQAIHLLLAFPLFVVVVGVDARWLSHSLVQRFPDLLATAGRAAGDGGALASPADYLEKIFQVPYRIPPMTESSCRALLAKLHLYDREPLAPAPESDFDDSPPKPRAPEADDPAATERLVGSPAGPDRTPERPAARPADESAAQAARIAALKLTALEVAAIDELAPLVGRSPRAAKRFLNTYRLLKSTVPSLEMAAFQRDAPGRPAGFRAPMLLLAVVVGAPALAAPVFASLRTAEPDQSVPTLLSQHRLDRHGPDRTGGRRLALALDTELWRPLTANALQPRLDRVARFSFKPV
jgi:hypothetical protein